VVWGTSDQWIGWAPMPPEQDYKLVSSTEFNNDKLWIFMTADKFLKGDCGDTVQALQAFDNTQPVNYFGLPSGDMADIDIDQHWTIKNIIKVIKIDIDIDNNCPTPLPLPKPVPILRMSPFHFDPPQHRRTSNDPNPTVNSTTPILNPIPPVRHGSGDPTPVNPVLNLPSHPVRGIIVGHGQDGGGKTGRGDGGRSNWKRPHLSILNTTGRGLNLSNTNAGVRTPSFAVGRRLSALSMGGHPSLNTIR
jgi:hypothetical protein